MFSSVMYCISHDVCMPACIYCVKLILSANAVFIDLVRL